MVFCRKCLLWLTLLSFLSVAVGVDRSKFRTCKDTGFCRRYRDFTSGPIFGSHYAIDKASVKLNDGHVTADIIPPVDNPNLESPEQRLQLNVAFYGSGSIRVKVSEETPRWQPLDLLLDDGSVRAQYELLQGSDSRIPSVLRSSHAAEDFTALALKNAAGGDGDDVESVLVIHTAPVKIELYRGNVLLISVNDRSLLHFEPSHASESESGATSRIALSAEAEVEEGEEEEGDQLELSEEERHGGKEVVDYGEDGLAIYADGTKEERRTLTGKSAERRGGGGAGSGDKIAGDSFGGHHDSMPRGARSVGVDVSFPFSKHVYGIPEHTTSLSLPTTAKGTASEGSQQQKPPQYSEPYRLYSLDVFEYEIGQTMALYGHIPVLFAHALAPGVPGVAEAKPRKSFTTGVFFFNPSEAFVDIADAAASSASGFKQSRWLFESGELDMFLLPGPSPAAVYKQYSALVGTQQLPPMFALGYHQCRWNYRDERDVAAVESMFEELDYPLDVIWLDIEHTDGKRYFTWDKRVFPNPLDMQRNLTAHGRKMVTIVDPHIKRDDNFAVHKEATAKGLYIKNKDGGDFDGWCWPGSSSYLDFTTPAVRQWWAEQFSLSKYLGSTLDLFTWNDMNEPSVFNGPEVSMPKDAQNLAGVEHREWHNLYGIYMQWATAMGLTQRSPDPAQPLRPFVLTRSFWAGSQRFGAMWTGDNSAQWSHLEIAAPMLLSINMAGLSFAGADVGGFFGDPSAELFARWYQAGSYTPFFRGHAHHDTKRREPWVFGEPYTSILRSAAMERYSLLPYWYSTFFETYSTGMPVMRPLFLEFPEDENTFAIDAQWMVGSALLVCPVTQEKRTSVRAYLPPSALWYDMRSLRMVTAAASTGDNNVAELAAPLDTIPVLIRAGSIIPRKMRLRRSSKLMFFDPFTIVVAPTATGDASGTLYMDDEQSLAHELNGAYSLRSFTFKDNTLTCSAATLPQQSHSTTSSSSRSEVQPTMSGQYQAVNSVERVQIAGIARAPSKVVLRQEPGSVSSGEEGKKELLTTELSFTFNTENKVLTIKKPDVPVTSDWTISLVL